MFVFSASQTWKELVYDPTAGPRPRSGHTVILSGTRMYVFFGVLRLPNGATLQLTDYWYFDLEHMKWNVLPNTLPLIPGVSGNFAVLISKQQRVVFYLASTKTPSFWIWLLTNNTWLPLSVYGHLSTLLFGATATLAPEYNYLYVLGRPVPLSHSLNASLTVLSSFNLYDYGNDTLLIDLHFSISRFLFVPFIFDIHCMFSQTQTGGLQ